MSWKETLAKVAPSLATALGGPFAGAAVKTIAEKWLDNPKATEQDIAETIGASDPSMLLQLRQLDKEFQKQMIALDIEDRKDARALAKINMIPQIILSAIYTAGYVLVLYGFLKGHVEIADNLKSEFNIVLGVLTAAQVQILNFWFGSSSGSKEKDKKDV